MLISLISHKITHEDVLISINHKTNLIKSIFQGDIMYWGRSLVFIVNDNKFNSVKITREHIYYDSIISINQFRTHTNCINIQSEKDKINVNGLRNGRELR
ncbi:hypothetical protein FGO68_gene12132 [Halteria grandinella]|uniref:Uncharacterized protein n=1 Tax=Halteria grandinella TaxID=5974 RepID=A0A8J8P5V6_HALGN|nr:hypothetical protein FGO68_gene12132 [Halteria grandinella]